MKHKLDEICLWIIETELLIAELNRIVGLNENL